LLKTEECLDENLATKDLRCHSEIKDFLKPNAANYDTDKSRNLLKEALDEDGSEMLDQEPSHNDADMREVTPVDEKRHREKGKELNDSEIRIAQILIRRLDN
jgi:hypothetical protein